MDNPENTKWFYLFFFLKLDKTPESILYFF